MQYNKYMPIAPEHDDLFLEMAKPNNELKIFFFDPDMELRAFSGRFRELLKTGEGEFLSLMDNDPVRLDRIITLNGKPGPAYDEYNSFADACLSCQAGYDE